MFGMHVQFPWKPADGELTLVHTRRHKICAVRTYRTHQCESADATQMVFVRTRFPNPAGSTLIGGFCATESFLYFKQELHVRGVRNLT